VLDLLMKKKCWRAEQESEDGDPAERDAHRNDVWAAQGLEYEKAKDAVDEMEKAPDFVGRRMTRPQIVEQRRTLADIRDNQRWQPN
jgi:chromatin segregation and condensation protein Rec8/ScpA/Scc1 (kleisin family)